MNVKFNAEPHQFNAKIIYDSIDNLINTLQAR